MSITFTNSFGSLTLARNPGYPEGSLGFEQARSESAGGVPFVRDWVVKNDIIPLPLRLKAAEVPQFLDFWRAKARGMARPFTYTDPSGGTASVRFADTSLPSIREHAYDMHVTTVRLRVEP